MTSSIRSSAAARRAAALGLPPASLRVTAENFGNFTDGYFNCTCTQDLDGLAAYYLRYSNMSRMQTRLAEDLRAIRGVRHDSP